MSFFLFLCYSFIIFSSVEPIWTIWILGVINRPDCKNQQIGEETSDKHGDSKAGMKWEQSGEKWHMLPASGR